MVVLQIVDMPKSLADAVRDLLPPIFSKPSQQPRTRLHFVDGVNCLAGNFKTRLVVNLVVCHGRSIEGLQSAARGLETAGD